MLAYATPCVYSSNAGEKLSADLGGSKPLRRTSAPTIAGAFFMPAMRYGGCARDTFWYAGVLEGRSANLRTVAPFRYLAVSGDDSKPQGVTPMAPLGLSNLINRSLESRASAHRAMAKSALFADSSARTRLKRYNYHLDKARELEALLAECLEATS